MTTSLDIVTRALRRLNIIAPDESPEDSEAQSALDALNDMIGSWPAQGLQLQETDFPLDQRFNGALVAMLAIRIAEDYGKQAGPVLTRDARLGWSSLQAKYQPNHDVHFDHGATYTSGRGLFAWIIQIGPDFDLVQGDAPWR